MDNYRLSMSSEPAQQRLMVLSRAVTLYAVFFFCYFFPLLKSKISCSASTRYLWTRDSFWTRFFSSILRSRVLNPVTRHWPSVSVFTGIANRHKSSECSIIIRSRFGFVGYTCLSRITSVLLVSGRNAYGFAVAENMPELTEIDATKKVSFDEPKKDAAADSDSDSSGVDAAAGKGGEGASGVTAEDLSNKARQSRGEKKARKIISKLGLKQVSPVDRRVA